jgi:hypothetical protein
MVEAEERVQRQRGMLAVPAQRQFAMQRGIVGIADRRDCRQAVERAAQDDHDEARVARVGGAGERGNGGGGEQRAAGAEQRAARQAWRLAERHGDHRR